MILQSNACPLKSWNLKPVSGIKYVIRICQKYFIITLTDINSVTTWIVSYCHRLTYSFGIIIFRDRMVRAIIICVNKIPTSDGNVRGHAHVQPAERNVRQTGPLCQKASKRSVIEERVLAKRLRGYSLVHARFCDHTPIVVGTRVSFPFFQHRLIFVDRSFWRSHLRNARSSLVKGDLFSTSNSF